MSINLFIWFFCPPSQCYICLSLRLQVLHGDIAPHVPQGLLLLQLLNHWGEGVGDDESHQGQPPDQDYQGGQTLLEILVKIVTERKLKVNIILTYFPSTATAAPSRLWDVLTNSSILLPSLHVTALCSGVLFTLWRQDKTSEQIICDYHKRWSHSCPPSNHLGCVHSVVLPGGVDLRALLVSHPLGGRP